jgi:hypothetical protein
MKNKDFIIVISLFCYSLQIQAQCFDFYIQTPLNHNVKACSSGGYSSSQVQQADNYSRTFAIEVFDSGTNSYNCHGYAWHKKEGGSSVWINNVGNELNNLNQYWTDGSYYVYNYNSQTHTDNLKVFYGNDDHTAITTSNPNIFISKMGCGCLVSHNKDNSPYTESNFTYYMRAPTISGPAIIAQTCQGNYTVSMPTGATFQGWSVTSGLTITSDNGVNGCTVSRASYENHPLTATLVCNYLLNGQSLTVQKKNYLTHQRQSVFCVRTELFVRRNAGTNRKTILFCFRRPTGPFNNKLFLDRLSAGLSGRK